MNAWFPESLYFGGLSYSILLLTTALLFYHMTRSKTLEMNPVASASFAIILVILSIGIIVTGLHSYSSRLRTITHDQKLQSEWKDYLEQEKKIFIIYFLFGCIYTMVAVGICYYIIKGSMVSFRLQKK